MYDQILSYMEATLGNFAQRVPPPQRVMHRDGFVYRYLEKTAEQAVVQKLARFVTGLRAAQRLFRGGLFQEQAAIQRILDEIGEDIVFLCLGIIDGKLTERHERYLEDFFLEEFDPIDESAPPPKRAMTPRDKIRAFIANHESSGDNPSAVVQSQGTISKVYSGFVHAASPHVMDMYDGNVFRVCGMLGTPRESEYGFDLWNYFYRGILSCAIAAKAFGNADLFDEISKFKTEFERVSGEAAE